MARLYLGKSGLQEYEQVLFIGNDRVGTTVASFNDGWGWNFVEVNRPESPLPRPRFRSITPVYIEALTVVYVVCIPPPVCLHLQQYHGW